MKIFKKDGLAYLLIVLGIAVLVVAPKGFAQGYNSTGNPLDNVSGEGYTAYGTQETLNYKDANANTKPTTYPATDATFTVSPEHGFSMLSDVQGVSVTPGDVVTHEAYWVTNEGNTQIPLTRKFYSKMSTSPMAQGWVVEVYEGASLLYTLLDGTTSTQNTTLADNASKECHYVVYVSTEADDAPNGSFIDLYTTFESSQVYAGKYTGGNAYTYSGTTAASDWFQDSTSAPDLDLTRTATIDAPKDYQGNHWDAVPGAIITFTMTITNEGSGEARDIVLIDKVPDNTDLACINTTGETTNVTIENGSKGTAAGWTVYYTTEATPVKDYGANGWVLIGILTTGAESFPGGGQTYAEGAGAYSATYVKWEKATIEAREGFPPDTVKKLTWGVTIR